MNTPSPSLPASALSDSDFFVSDGFFVSETSSPAQPAAQTGRFTLVRLLIVIALVGTLSALAAPMIFPMQP